MDVSKVLSLTDIVWSVPQRNRGEAQEDGQEARAMRNQSRRGFD